MAFPESIAEAKKLLKSGVIKVAEDTGHECPVRGDVWWSYETCEDCNPDAVDDE